MEDKGPDFGGIWIRDPSELFDESDSPPRGTTFTFPVFVFYGGGFMLRLRFEIDPWASEPDHVDHKGFAYMVDGNTLCLTPTTGGHTPVRDEDIVELEWRYANKILEFWLPDEERWSRWFWASEEDAMFYLKMPREFFVELRKAGAAGNFTYFDRSVVPGPIQDGSR